MTRTLVLIRHARAEADDPAGDHARALAARGVADAGALGRLLAGEGLVPDLVLASPARRTRQTTEHALAGAGAPDAEVWGGRGLYDGGPDAVLAAVREVPEETGVLWVVGHQPTVGLLAGDLADRATSDPAALRTLADGVPTATAAVLTLEVPWADLDPGAASARLTALRTARA